MKITVKFDLLKIFRFFKNIFCPKQEAPEPPFNYGKLCCISFAINRYQQSPLRGCLNDQADITDRIKQFWPDFVFRLFQDSKCTWQRFEQEILKAFESMAEGWLVIHYSGHGTFKSNPAELDGYSEALYLYNGPYADYQIYELMKKKPPKLNVVFILDSCFSTGVTCPRHNNEIYRKSRFLASEPMPEQFKVRRAIINEPLEWIVFAACGERETASDAYINGRYNGAFTFYFKQIMRPGVFFSNWQRTIDKYLPTNDYPQTPSLTGKQELINKIPFELNQ